MAPDETTTTTTTVADGGQNDQQTTTTTTTEAPASDEKLSGSRDDLSPEELAELESAEQEEQGAMHAEREADDNIKQVLDEAKQREDNMAAARQTAFENHAAEHGTPASQTASEEQVS